MHGLMNVQSHEFPKPLRSYDPSRKATDSLLLLIASKRRTKNVFATKTHFTIHNPQTHTRLYEFIIAWLQRETLSIDTRQFGIEWDKLYYRCPEQRLMCVGTSTVGINYIRLLNGAINNYCKEPINILARPQVQWSIERTSKRCGGCRNNIYTTNNNKNEREV